MNRPHRRSPPARAPSADNIWDLPRPPSLLSSSPIISSPSAKSHQRHLWGSSHSSDHRPRQQSNHQNHHPRHVTHQRLQQPRDHFPPRQSAPIRTASFDGIESVGGSSSGGIPRQRSKTRSSSSSLELMLGDRDRPPSTPRPIRKGKRRPPQGLQQFVKSELFKWFAALLVLSFLVSFSIAYLSVRFATVGAPGYLVAEYVTMKQQPSVQSSSSSTLPPYQQQTQTALSISSQKRPLLSNSQLVPVSLFERYTRTAPICTPMYSEHQVSFTLVTQFNFDQIWMMAHHCHRWSGPISVVVVVQQQQVLPSKSSSFLQKKKQISATSQPQLLPYDDHHKIEDQLIHYGCDHTRLTVQTLSWLSRTMDYPVNVVRNKALAMVKTSHVMYVDVDFWPSVDLEDNLKRHRHLLKNNMKSIVIIPAFQLYRQCSGLRDCRDRNIPAMPERKDDLLDLVDQRRGDPYDPEDGHGSTRYADWFDQSAEVLLPIECIKSNHYEPYVVFRYCRDLPPFHEGFLVNGKSKRTWIMHLRRAGWRFWQLGESYVVHYPVAESRSRILQTGDLHGEQIVNSTSETEDFDLESSQRGHFDQLFLDFKRWLKANVPDETQVHKCPNAVNDDDKL